MFFPVDEWFPAFALTVLVEGIVVLVALRGAGVALPRLAAISMFANLSTHPVVWFVLTQVLLAGTTEYLLVAEGWAVAAEAAFYWIVLAGVTARRALAVSILANAASFAAGGLLSFLLTRSVPLPA